MTPIEFKEWRTTLGLSQTQAADALGISRGSVENYESGRRREDSRPVEIPLTVSLACDAVSIWSAATRGDPTILTDGLRTQIADIAAVIGTRRPRTA